MLLKHYLLIILPINVVVSQGASMSSLLGSFDIFKIVGCTLLLCNITFIIIHLNEIMHNRIIFSVFAWIILLIFVFSLQPAFTFLFTYSVIEFGPLLKLSLWTTTTVLATLAFRDWSDIRQLRYSALCAFGIIVIGLTIANIFKMGHSAYNLGTFYIGRSDLAPLSMALVSFLPFFFVLSGRHPEAKPISLFTIFLVVVDFVLIVLIMKRSSILAFLICCPIILFLFGINPLVRFSIKGFIVLSMVSILSISCLLCYVFATRREIVEDRFKDMTKYEKSGDIAYLGAGRWGLTEHYLALYMQLPLTQQIFGVDITGYIDKRMGGFLHTGYRSVPHNDYLECLMKGGMLGLIIYMGFLLSMLKTIWKVFRVSRKVLSVELSAVAIGMFSVYFVSSIAGMNYRVLAMTCFALLLGATLGVASRDNSLPGGTVAVKRQ